MGIMGIFDLNEPADTPNFPSDLTSGPTAENTSSSDKELEDFILHEKQKANVNAQILEFNDLCWEKCFKERPGSKLSGSVETCLNNCLDRFIDTTVFVYNRFTNSPQKIST